MFFSLDIHLYEIFLTFVLIIPKHTTMVDYDKMVADARDELFACVAQRRFSEEEVARVHGAYALAEEAHRPQRRKSGEPYILHPIAVAMIVANEIGLGGTSINAVQRRFTDLLGWLNQYVASKADSVILMVSGIPVKIK